MSGPARSVLAIAVAPGVKLARQGDNALHRDARGVGHLEHGPHFVARHEQRHAATGPRRAGRGRDAGNKPRRPGRFVQIEGRFVVGHEHVAVDRLARVGSGDLCDALVEPH